MPRLTFRTVLPTTNLLAALLLSPSLAAAVGGAPPAETTEPSELERVLQAGADLLAAGVDPNEGVTEEDLPPAPELERQLGTDLNDRPAEIAQAIERYRQTGEAATIKRSTVEIFPYGETQPVVRCSPFVICDIELEAGEIVTDFALGAPKLWDARPMISGDPANPTPHVIVWPLDYDLATNAVIATTRRTYHLSFISPSKEDSEKSDSPYHRNVAFYYPGNTVRRWNSIEEARERLAAKEAERQDDLLSVSVPGLDLDEIVLDYRLKVDKKVTWAPDLVFDNGRQVYLHFPPAVRSTDFPTLLVEGSSGELGVANFRVSPDGEWMIFDGLFKRARLVAGTGRKQRRVEIRKGA